MYTWCIPYDRFSCSPRLTNTFFYDSRRNIAILSLMSLGGSYFIMKSRTLAEKKRERAVGDYSVSVDRSGTFASAQQLT
ncbi:uncharacterized protein K441DRAFT_567913 [Cenococcum geophilum 1.58]|uniref:uncharacterized protein n=1 Tax=Cenococcum geophilum 1.58 TaxID=794803 RepID=UPI00358EF97E|nr:hypothetical protein K441DRAFT_567913 [Cenococcum geophilum 1.58]